MIVCSALVKSPTWSEGWQAHAAGWPLYKGHTPAYEQGWLARATLVDEKAENFK